MLVRYEATIAIGAGKSMVTKNQWRLALAGVVIVVATQLPLTFEGIKLHEVVLSADGHVFASSSFRSSTANTIHHWQPGLTDRKRVVSSTIPVHSLACTHDGELLLYVEGGVLIGYDPKANSIRWTCDVGEAQNVDVFPIMRDKFTVLIENALSSKFAGRRPPKLHIVRNTDGLLVGSIDDISSRHVTCVGDCLNYFDRSSSPRSVQILASQGGPSELISTELSSRVAGRDQSAATTMNEPELAAVWSGHLRPPLRYRSSRGEHTVTYTSSPLSFAPSRLVMSNLVEGKTIGERWISLRRVHVVTISIIAAILLIGWLMLLTFDADGDLSSRRLWTDVVILFVVTMLTCIDYGWAIGLNSISWEANARAPALLIGVVLSLLFIVPLASDRPFHLWGLFLVACAFPLLAPMLGLALLLKYLGFQFELYPKTSRITMVPQVFKSPTAKEEPIETESSSPGIRFGIREMMMVTAGIAIFISIGWQSFFMLVAGIGLAMVLGFAALLSHNAEFSHVVAPLALAGFTLTGAGDANADAQLATGALFMSICLTFGFLGSRWRCVSTTPTQYRRTSRGAPESDSIRHAVLE
ncbi:MAG: hypothetical protein ACR2NZ_16710 [Rubripirellula sp.]